MRARLDQRLAEVPERVRVRNLVAQLKAAEAHPARPVARRRLGRGERQPAEVLQHDHLELRHDIQGRAASLRIARGSAGTARNPPPRPASPADRRSPKSPSNAPRSPKIQAASPPRPPVLLILRITGPRETPGFQRRPACNGKRPARGEGRIRESWRRPWLSIKLPPFPLQRRFSSSSFRCPAGTGRSSACDHRCPSSLRSLPRPPQPQCPPPDSGCSQRFPPRRPPSARPRP